MNKKHLTRSIFFAIVLILGGYFFLFKNKAKACFIAGQEFGISYTELTLFTDNTFKEVRDGLFFDETTTGTYTIQKDTVFFDSYTNENHTYAYGCIKYLHGQRVFRLYGKNDVYKNQFGIDLNKLIK